MREIKFRFWSLVLKSMSPEANLPAIAANGSGFFKILNVIIPLQFTGLKDKNGKEIYEGDVLKHDLWGNSEIIWEHGMFRGINTDHDITLADHQLKRSRVIGNIYENPELKMKGE